MARVFGERSKYLIVSKNLGKIGTALMGILLAYLAYGFFSNFSKPFTVIGLIVLLLMYYPITVLLFKNLRKYKKEAKGYEKGENGEDDVLEELQKLSDDYLVFQDLKFQRNAGNVDFFVVGPTGAFAIEVKNLGGKIGFNGQKLLLYGKSLYFKNPLKQAMSGACKVHNILLNDIKKEYFINPLLVFSSEKAFVDFWPKPAKGVIVAPKKYLCQAIIGNRYSFSQESINKIKNDLSKYTYPNRIRKNKN